MPKLIEVPIDKDIPIPEYTTKAKSKHEARFNRFPWAKMEVGDSFFVPYQLTTGGNGALKSGYTFLRRRVEGGYRIWRTK